MAQLTSEIESRFALYVEELQACARSRGVPHGSPEDLPIFLQQVADPGRLRSEISSLVRATIFREQEEISPEQIVELLTFAIGGPEAAAQADFAHVQQQLRMLVGEIFRGLWPRFSEPAPTAPAPPPEPIHLDTTAAAARALHTAYREEILLHTDAEPENTFAAYSPSTERSFAEEAVPSRPPQRPIPHLQLELHHAVEPEAKWFNANEAEQQPAPLAEPPHRHDDFLQEYAAATQKHGLLHSVRSLWRDPEPEITEAGEYPQYSALELTNPERRRYILLGVGGLIVGAALGSFIWRVPAAPPSHTTASPSVQFSPDHSTAATLAPEAPAPLAPITADPVAPSAGVTHDAFRSRAHRVTNRDWDRALGLGSSSSPRSEDPEPIGDATPARTEPMRGTPAQASPDAASDDNNDADSTPQPAAPTSGVAGMRVQPRVLVNGGSIYLSVAGPMAANLLSAPVPQYPPSARAAGVQGAVTVQAVVGLQGDVVATRVLSGPPLLRGAAQAAVHRWRFVPYLVGGRPSMFTTEALVDFRGAH